MGDRTNVSLRVLKEHLSTVESIYKSRGWNAYQEVSGDAHVDFDSKGVNYGQLPFLPDLVRAGIAFDSRWDSGDTYSSGTEYSRFTEVGAVKRLSIYDNEINPDIEVIRALLDKPDELVTFLKQHIDSKLVMPWDNQLEFAKLYLTLQLIQPAPT